MTLHKAVSSSTMKINTPQSDRAGKMQCETPDIQQRIKLEGRNFADVHEIKMSWPQLSCTCGPMTTLRYETYCWPCPMLNIISCPPMPWGVFIPCPFHICGGPAPCMETPGYCAAGPSTPPPPCRITNAPGCGMGSYASAASGGGIGSGYVVSQERSKDEWMGRGRDA